MKYAVVAAAISLLSMLAVGQSYNEPFRPRVHFSPKQHWTNDPNGLVYFEGEYHLFFQYNPFGDTWGHMSWGHAVSPDLIHWRELPVALPEADGVMIYTGSVVIDRANTSGFCLNGKGCMVAIYTGAKQKPPEQAQYLAYSNDRGRTWNKYAKNPVLDLHMADFRDPNVFWSDESKRWIMAVSLPNDHKVAFYASPNLKVWARVSEFGPAGAVGGQWECPDLFEAPVDGDGSKSRWVLKIGLNPGGLQGGSGEQYFIGRFDGTRFINDNPAGLTLWSDYGKDCYCALTFNNMPASRPPTMLGWMNNWQYANKVPTSPWRGQMTIPRELSLKTFPEGIRLVQKPVGALNSLRGDHALGSGSEMKLSDASFLVTASLEMKGATVAGWKIGNDAEYTAVGYDAARRQLFVDRSHSASTAFSPEFPGRTEAPFTAVDGRLSLEILVDRNSVEVFSGDGRVAITNLVFAPAPTKLVFFTEGTAKATQGTVEYWPLRSVW